MDIISRCIFKFMINFIVFRSVLFQFLISIIVITGFLGGCTMINRQLGLSDDNIVEELLEKEIENRIGLSVDLSPSSPE